MALKLSNMEKLRANKFNGYEMAKSVEFYSILGENRLKGLLFGQLTEGP